LALVRRLGEHELAESGCTYLRRQAMTARNAFPIAVMSFDRPQYLQEVLSSLKSQNVEVDEHDIYLFQDSFASRVHGGRLADPAAIEHCEQIFRNLFPRGTVVRAEQNLGVALNFDRAERLFFLDMESDVALFLEDDLVLSQFYLSAVTKLIEFALSEPRIAYVAAYGDHRASLEKQRSDPHRIIQMRHKWGFALTRRQWLRQRDIMEQYLEIVRATDYGSRKHEAIRAYYKLLGYGSPGTSQDGMKDAASALLGTTKIMSFICYGKNIGKRGVHSRESFYEQEGFGRTELFPDEVDYFALPSTEKLDSWIKSDREAAVKAAAS
jgi:hypothetical protein